MNHLKMNSTMFLHLILLLLHFVFTVDGDSIQRLPECVYYHSNIAKVSVLSGDDEPAVKASILTNDQGRHVNITTCRKSTDFCYAFWKDDNQNSTIIISQGCWESSSPLDCSRTLCLASSKSSRVFHQSRFCCCSGNLCNIRVGVESSSNNEALDAVQTHDSLSQSVPQLASQVLTKETVVIFVSVGIVMFLIVASILLFQTCRKKWSKSAMTSKRNPPDTQSQPLISGPNFDSLKLVEIIGHGRYGTVWKACLQDVQVAVKVFSPPARCYYYNEREIYSLPFIEHGNILGYLGYQEVSPPDGSTEYRLILDYRPLGCLQDYLRHNTIDWTTLCKMGRSIASGLAHLHTDYRKGDQMKMCVAHRDINSRNVLVKSDLTCCLCDFGFAIQISGAHYYFNGEEQHAETSSLNDVGTLRYMAPEVLEGAVNLRECESSLKQIDVYALGLVLWEIAYRCSDLYPTKEVPPFQLPFEDETGPHPTLEQMKMLVCRHKARPILPDAWRDSNASIRLLKATLEDSWDQDAEARLTALCVEERWSELPILWEREKHKGFSPTLHSNVTHETDNESIDQRSDQSTRNKESSSNSTITDIMKVGKNNSSAVWPPSPRPLQPHQGRNPCLERNTMVSTQEEFSVSGNALVDRSLKHKQIDPPAMRLDSVSSDARSSSSGFSAYARVVNPIPYVQNAVREPDSPYNKDSGMKEEVNAGLGKFLSGFFRRKRNGPNSAGNEEWEEHQRLCPTLSSPSDAESPPQVVVKTNNQSVTPKATEVRWEEPGFLGVSLVKSNLPKESSQVTVNNPAFNESSGSGAKAEVGVAKLQAPISLGFSPKLMRRQETKSAAMNGCDKTPTVNGLTPSGMIKPHPLSAHTTPTSSLQH